MSDLGRFKRKSRKQKFEEAAARGAPAGQMPPTQPSSPVLTLVTKPASPVPAATAPAQAAPAPAPYGSLPGVSAEQPQYEAPPTAGGQESAVFMPTSTPDFYTRFGLPSPNPPGNLPIMGSDAQFYETETNYLGGLGDFWSDLVTTAESVITAKSAQKTAEAQAATAAAQAAQARALQASRSGLLPTGALLGLTPTTWMMIAAAGVGGYLLLSRRRR